VTENNNLEGVKVHFFAQILEESGTSLRISQGESLNYSAARLKDGEYLNGDWVKGDEEAGISGYYENGTKWKSGPFSYFKEHQDKAELYGRKDLNARGDGLIQSANQQAITNRAYSNRYGNGNVDSGDGWRYWGKGLIQLTWKDNYTAVNDKIQEKYPECGINIINDPESILTTKGALVSACAYWYMKKLNAKADGGLDEESVDSITEVINRNTDSYGARRSHFQRVCGILEIEECKNF